MAIGEKAGADPDAVAQQAIILATTYQQTGELPLLIKAITLFRNAAAAPGVPADRAGRLSVLGSALALLFERTGDTAALEEAVMAGRAAAAAAPLHHPLHAATLCNLGHALALLFKRTGKTEVLEEAVQASRNAVESTPRDDPDCVMYLNNLGNHLREFSVHTGNIAALEEAIRASRDVTDATPASHPDRAGLLANLGNGLLALYERTGSTAALDQAIQANRDAVRAAPVGHPHRARCLNNFGNALQRQYERSGDITALAEAVQAGRGVVQATPADHPDLPAVLASLGCALRSLFECSGDITLIGEAMRAHRDAVQATPADHPDRARWLSNLGITLRAISERTGDATLAEEAVQAARDAAQATSASHPDRPAVLTNLAIALGALSERTGDTSLLEEAIQAYREALRATPEGHPDRPVHLHNLGGALQALSGRTANPEALGEAVQAARDALRATPAAHTNHAKYLGNLSGALQAVFERTGNTTALEEAVQAGRATVHAIPTGHPDRAGALSNLGRALQLSSSQTATIAVLDEAIRTGRDAAHAAPEGHPDRAAVLTNLGHALRVGYERSGRITALTEAAHCFKQAAEDLSAPVVLRAQAYSALAGLPVQGHGSARDALADVEAAVALLPQVAPSVLRRADRERNLGQLMSLAGAAAATAVTAGRPDRAVELLEQARGILVADILGARSSDVTQLRSQHPDLAGEFDKARARIDVLGHLGTGGHPAQGEAHGAAEARRESQVAWGQLLARIRSLKGMENFLRAPGIKQLASHAGDGPVVFPYTSSTRCDALILTGNAADPVRLVPLPRLTEAEANRHVRRMVEAQDALRNAGPAALDTVQAEILDILEWTWDSVCEPALRALGHTAIPTEDQPWPRVWWCPVGVLTYLPLHAAGYHRRVMAGPQDSSRAPRTVMDRVISSYTPTVRGLAYARTRHAGQAMASTLIVPVPDAPGTPPLPGTAAEVGALTTFLPDADILPHPTRDRVLAALPEHHLVHFACHGYADSSNPASGQLILNDHKTSPLTVADVSALHLTGGLAYLSACDTAVTSPALANESVHIAGAFHLAGYEHVVGTLWPVGDSTASILAHDFYRHLTKGGTSPPDISLAAPALHHATQMLRDRCPGAPAIWAAHTHTGT